MSDLPQTSTDGPIGPRQQLPYHSFPLILLTTLQEKRSITTENIVAITTKSLQ